MSHPEVPPLANDVLALVRRVANIEAAPAEAKARVFARVAVHLGPPGGGGGEPSGDARGASAAAPSPTGVGLLRRLLPLAASFALGGAAGATAMHAAMHPTVANEKPPRGISVEKPAATPAVVAPLAAAPAATPGTGTPPDNPAPRAGLGGTLPRPDVPSPRPVAGPSEQLARERMLLDVARGALEREEGAAALAATERHGQKYPNGMLAQEREAMAVRALVMLGRTDEARTRVQGFRGHFPDSVLLPALVSAVGETPAP
jgi:hypothetical protein